MKPPSSLDMLGKVLAKPKSIRNRLIYLKSKTTTNSDEDAGFFYPFPLYTQSESNLTQLTFLHHG